MGKAILLGIALGIVAIMIIVVVRDINKRGYILPKCHGAIVCQHPKPTPSVSHKVSPRPSR